MLLLPQKTDFIFENLNKSGFECYAVGGCVRDLLMGNTPQDYDFTTDATPQEIIKCFDGYKVFDTGIKYGTISVVCDGECYEITTFRVDGKYSDSRHPDEVLFSKSIVDDLSRRDFTINSIAFNSNSGIVDPFGGIDDINNKIIRATGNPYDRMREDALRILRGLRFSSRLGFSIDNLTLDAMYENKEQLSLVHPFRIRNELEGLLKSDNASEVLYTHREIIKEVIPEISPMFDFVQNNPHHKFDVWRHTVEVVKNTPPDLTLRISALFHDIGKPFSVTTDKKGINHFKGHQYVSYRMAVEILERFGFSRSIINDVGKLVLNHDERFKNINIDIKRVLKDIDAELFEKLLILSKADMLSQSDYKRQEKLSHHKAVEEEYKRIIRNGECYKISQLKINGDDLKALGFEGREIGEALSECLDAVIRGEIENNIKALLDYVKRDV